MKKIFLLLVLAVIAPIFLNTNSAQAMIVDEEGTRWWEVEELSQTITEMNAIIEEQCGNESECRVAERTNLIDNNGKYLAASNLDDMTLMITEINPLKGTIKVLFDGEDNIMKWEGLKPKIYNLNKLKIILIEDMDVDSLIFQTEQEGISGWSEIYNYSGGETPIKNGIETELTVPSSVDLLNNGYGVIEYSVKIDRFSTSGSIDYSPCIQSSFYTDGISCRVLISEYSGISYGLYAEGKYIIGEYTIESKTGIDENIPVLTNRELSEENNNPQIADNNQIQSEKITTQDTVNSPSNISNKTEDINTTNSDVMGVTTENIEIPNSGNNCNDDSFSFPWWFLILLAILDIFLVWWWMPNEKAKKVKKS